ncbi:MAG: lysylphosphatidylglycerol synthase transmembrane domain-containing protein [Longimicrobiales bacterium]|nr:lysylphosphatidylglycerol synthase transmembrane domain-containing protein [Longimicrobiales bacterium]
MELLPSPEGGGGPHLKKILVLLAQITATIVVTWFIASQAGLTASQLRQVDFSSWDVHGVLFALSCLVLLVGYFGTGILWGRIVRGLGGPALGASTSIRLFMVANLGRYVPGKVWQIAGLVALARKRDVPASTATAAAVLGQGIGLASATVVGLMALWTVADGAAWRWTLPVVLLGGTALALAPPVFHAVVGAWFRLAKTEQPGGLRPRRAMGWLGLGLVTWVLYGWAFWILVESLGLSVTVLPTASAFAAAYVLGYVMVFAPAGLGVREGFLVALMAPQIGAGPAGAVAIIARLWTTVIEVIPAAAFWTRHVTRSHAATEPHE